VIPQLYAYTECEVSISSNMVIIKDRHPVEMSANEVLRYLTDRLRDQICAELELALKELRDQEHWLTLEQIFIEKRVYKRIEEARTEEMVTFEVHEGMKPYRKELKRALTDEDVHRLLDIRIRRISKYDINKNRKQLRDVADGIDEVNAKLGALTQTTILYLQGILAKYGENYPRRSEIAKFDAVDKKAVAQQNIKVSYDPETGFFGSDVKGADHQMTLSEYDRVLAISDDGSFRIIGPETKVLIPGKALYLAPFDVDKGKAFTVVYRDADRIAFAKKVHIHKFIRDKEYELIKGKEGKIDLLLPGSTRDAVRLSFVPKKRQRVSEAEFDLGTLELTGVTARGARLAPKPIARVKHIANGPPDETLEPMLPPRRDSVPPRRSVPPPPPPSSPKASAPPPKRNGDDDGPQRKLF
jgi:topoisomerase-4 subunit A